MRLLVRLRSPVMRRRMLRPSRCLLSATLFFLLASAPDMAAFGPDVTVNDAPSQQYTSLQSSGVHSIAASGQAVHIVWADDRNGYPPSIRYSRSVDGGRNFGPNLNLSPLLDYCWSATINVAQNGTKVYVAWTRYTIAAGVAHTSVYFCRSDDSGLTFGTPMRLDTNDQTADGSGARYPAMCVSSDGLLTVAWIDTRHPDSYYNSLYLTQSHDGGMTFTADRRIELVYAQDPQIVDLAAGSGNRMYLAVEDRYGGDGYDVLVAASFDGATTFQPTTRIGAFGRVPSIRVTLDGVVHVAYLYDHYISFIGQTYHVEYARSSDQGISFTSPHIIYTYDPSTGAPGSPSLAGGGSLVGIAWRPHSDEIACVWSTDGGHSFNLLPGVNDDTSGFVSRPTLSLNAGGQIYVAWEDHHGGLAADIKSDHGILTSAVSGSGIASLPTTPALTIEPNPVRTEASVRFFLPEGHGDLPVTCGLYDVSGREIHALVDDLLAPGEYRIGLGLDSLVRVPPGIYFVRLSAGSTVVSAKLVAIP